ncbi:MAG: tetratricopeptide repeat protein [Gordonia sp. (in: high G+C Gram-positive bacteria)]|uniref:tetratricopeptide repeat protein n=1 Tax=Gordonia sp. (in: high G+C Gram-positive bacteria) TaxID=84139 RepID=UPI003BB626DF
MTGPRNRQQSAAGLQAAAAMSGAVDLSALAAKAEAARQAPVGGSRDADGAGGASGAIVEVTDASFEAVVARSQEQLVVVELHTPRSPESLELSPVLAGLAERAGGRWLLARVNVDTSPGIAQAFGVQSVPMVVALAGGQPVAAFNGPQPQAQIQGWLDDIFAQVGDMFGDAGPAPEQPEDPRMLAAEELMNDGDLDAALAAYRAVAETEPANVEAVAAAKNLEFILRAQAHDPSIVDTAAPDDADAQFAAADVLLLSQQPEVAFERVLAVVRSSVGDDKDRARTFLLELFELFDPADPVVVAARRKLAAALY